MSRKTKPAAGGVRRAGSDQYNARSESSTASLRAALRWRQHAPADALILARRRVNRALRRLHMAAAVGLYPHAGCRWHCERMTALKAVTP